MIKYILLISALVAICSLIYTCIKQANKRWSVKPEKPVRLWHVSEWFERITWDPRGSVIYLLVVFGTCALIMFGAMIEYAKAKVWLEASGINLTW
jgi:hypothetical protein